MARPSQHNHGSRGSCLQGSAFSAELRSREGQCDAVRRQSRCGLPRLTWEPPGYALERCRKDRSKAVDILVKDLKVFASYNEELYKEITQLLTLEDFR